MQDNIFRKGLVLGIIALFVVVSISSVVTAIYNDSNTDYELMYKSKKYGKSDGYKEIITFISGGEDSNWINRNGFFRGEVKSESGGSWGIPLHLSGLRQTNGRLERYSISVLYVHAYLFRGFITKDSQVYGYALGNIQWSN